MEREDSFLDALNGVQLKAANHPPTSSLQILAGPGSGKTRVLTSRIAHLILNCHIPPMAICAVTFTNKAANEMRERLTKLLGQERISQLKMGTFHSLCARFLRKYAMLVGVQENFTVCDASESKKIIATALKAYEKELKDRNLTLEPGTAASMISKAKSRGQSAECYLIDAKAKAPQGPPGTGAGPLLSLEIILGEVYVEYEATLKKNGALDFDDLLVYGVKLFAGHPLTVSWCQHILVDEFQDTNITQYDLMRAIANATNCVTIVVYGWRAAEIENLAKMRRDFPDTTQIFLEENYRSTGAILEASLEIVSQDSKRISKSLYTSHPDGITPVLYQVYKEQEEASFIAVEIKRLIANMGGAFKWGDFAILLRYNALSRNIESALQREGIPCRILGGHRFFERLEVKDILAHLQLIDNPAFVPALQRVINVPGRGIGEKTLSEILQRADRAQKSPLELLEGIYDMRLPDSKPSIRKKISSFVQAMRKLHKLAEGGMGPSELIHQLLDLVQYRDHLRKTQPDWETRWENVKELITFAKEVEEQNARDAAAQTISDEDVLDHNISPLRQFLQVSMLSSAGDNDGDENSQDKVTITTCHSAKGLEWPVVMIPSVDASTYPFIRSEDEDEERRLLYVACTRAKALLYLTRSTTRMVAGDQKTRGLSKFINRILEDKQKENKPPLFMQRVPQLELEDRAIICKVLERPVPDEEQVEQMVENFVRLGREHPPAIQWRPMGSQPSANPQSSWQFPPPLLATSSSTPLSTFGRPVVPGFNQEGLNVPPSFFNASSPDPIAVFGRPAVPGTNQQAYMTSVGTNQYGSLQNAVTPISRRPVQPPPKVMVGSGSASPSTRVKNERTAPTSALSFGKPLGSHFRSSAVALNPGRAARESNVINTHPPMARQPGPQKQHTIGNSNSTFRPPQVLRSSGNTNGAHKAVPMVVPTPATISPVKKVALAATTATALPREAKPAIVPTPIGTGVNHPAGPGPHGVKRRLGMAARAAGGYSNKKFKPPTL